MNHALPIDAATAPDRVRVRSRALALARAGWWGVFALSILNVVIVAPELYRLLTTASGVVSALGWTPEMLQAGLRALGLPADFVALQQIALGLLLAVSMWGVSLILVWRQPREGMALFAAYFLTGFAGVALYWNDSSPALVTLRYTPLSGLMSALSWMLLVPFLCLFPDGRLVPRWVWLCCVGWGVYSFFWTIPAGPYSAINWPPLLSAVVFMGSFLPAALAQVYRYRRVSNAVQRQQMKWLVFGFLITFVFALGVLAYDASPLPSAQATLLWLLQTTVASLGLLTLPLALGVAILRYRLWDVDLLINRAVVYGALTACVVGLYILVVGGLGALFQSGGNLLVSLLATGLVALLFNPLRVRWQQTVNRLMYGDRDDPTAVLARLGRQLEGALAPAEVLPVIVATICTTLKLPYAAIRLPDDSLTAHGALPNQIAAEAFALVYQGETLGQLIAAPRASGEVFTSAERALLTAVAQQAGVAVHAARLSIDLQHARERLVTAREEERRRLRRDLHDGLGPKLAGQTLILEAVRDSLAPEAASRGLIDHLIEDSQTIVGEVRQLVHGLRPPALDELGFVAAVRAVAAQYEQGGLRITLAAPEPFPPLPAAVEVAAYRIVQEALTNVVRHARAARCEIRLALSADALSLEIQDNGVGLSPARQAGVGLASMRERAEEIGGHCTVEAARDGGTRVGAELPTSR